jgi:hypothetical protein
MKLSLRTVATLPCLTAFLAMAGTAHAASIVNGSFSSPIATGWTTNGIHGTTPGQGITIITLGTANDTGFGDNVPVDGSATNAAYFVDDNTHAIPETLSQALSLAANTTYTLTFDIFGVGSGDNNQFDDTFTASAGGASKSFTDFVTQNWTGESLIFTTGAAGNYDITFSFDAGPTPAKDIALTNVAISGGVGASPVPEPGSLALFGTGILGLAGAAKRKFLARS